MSDENPLEEFRDRRPAHEHPPIVVKGEKRLALKLDTKKLGAEARVLQRNRAREDLLRTSAMWWKPALMMIGAIVFGTIAYFGAAKERQKLLEMMKRPEGFAAISATTAGVLVQQFGSTATAVGDMQICDGDIILTGTNSETTIRYTAENTVMFLRPNTLMKMTQKNGKFIELARGYLIAEVAKQPDGTNMIVMTPYAEVTITGGRFDFRVTREFSRLEVNGGEILVRPRTGNGKAVTVHAGEYTEATDKSSLTVLPLSSADVQVPQTSGPNTDAVP